MIIILLFLTVKGSVVCQDYFQKGYENYMQSHNFLYSVELFTKAIENNQEPLKSYTYRGAAKMYMQDFKGASADFDTARKMDPTYYKIYYYESTLYFNMGYLTMANNCIDLALSLNPYDGASHDSKSGITLGLGDTLSALRYSDSAVYLDSKDYGFRSNHGYIHYLLGNYQVAIADFDLSIELGDSTDAYAFKGRALTEIGRYEEAISCFNTAIKNAKKAINLHYLRGLTYKRMGEVNLACDDFYKSIELGYLTKELATQLCKE